MTSFSSISDHTYTSTPLQTPTRHPRPRAQFPKSKPRPVGITEGPGWRPQAVGLGRRSADSWAWAWAQDPPTHILKAQMAPPVQCSNVLVCYTVVPTTFHQHANGKVKIFFKFLDFGAISFQYRELLRALHIVITCKPNKH